MRLHTGVKCKRVKIASISTGRPPGADWKLRGENGEQVTVSSEWVSRHNPSIGGYHLLYEGGYESYAPADPFGEGHAHALVLNGMKTYRCVKTVQAFKITRIVQDPPLGRDLGLRGENGEWAGVSEEWVARHEPKLGGYYVLYKDGYASYSPAEAFEEGYVPA